MKKWPTFLKSLVWSLLGLCGVIVAACTVIFIYAEWQLPDVDKLKDAHLQVPLRVYSADGLLIGQFGTKQRMPVSLMQVPQSLIHAVLATEDARFYQHSGVDMIGIFRAAVAVIASGKKVQGASTITMQVARNFYLSREKTYIRKIKEILLALKIDRELTKDKILELYLNKIYFGYRAYGVAVAARTYYGKSLQELSLAQMAMIAGLPQAPSRNNPIDSSELALKRRNHVLARMKQVGFIDRLAYQKAVAEPDNASFHRYAIQLSAPYVAEMVRQTMLQEYGEAAYEKGLSVYTTIDSNWQRASDKALRHGLLAFDKRHGFRGPITHVAKENLEQGLLALKKRSHFANVLPSLVTTVNSNSIEVLLSDGSHIKIPWQGLSWARPVLDNDRLGAYPTGAAEIVQVGDIVSVTENPHHQWRLSQLPAVQGALVAIDPNNGAIKALSGGFDYHITTFNRVIQAERQTGSIFKPFIYSAALNKGFTLASIINDAPIVTKDNGENVLWRPNNDNLAFYGPTPLRQGLIKSRNLISIRLLQSMGIPYALDYLSRFGFDVSRLPNTLSLALGSGVSTPLQVARGYAVFANGGSLVRPYFIKKILGPKQAVIYRAKLNGQGSHAISEQNAYLMTQTMRDVIQHGTGRAAKVLQRSDIAGKTGTTNDQVDAWFSGFNSNVVATVWVGFDEMSSLHEYAARAALPIWIDFMRDVLHDSPLATMAEPSGIISVRIDPETGLLALPTQDDAKFEIFRQQYAPQRYARKADTIDHSPGHGLFSDDNNLNQETIF